MRKLMLAAAAVATAVVPATASAAESHKGPAKKTVKVCVGKGKHGFKARVSAKCKHGEKTVMLKIPVNTVVGPAGPAGAQGPQGLPGTAGANGSGFVVKDASANVVGQEIAYDGYSIWTLLSDGTIEPVNAGSGQINYNSQYSFAYTSSDCTGQAYVYSGAPQTPFTAPGDTGVVGSPLYLTSGPVQTINVGSYWYGGTASGSCQSNGAYIDTEKLFAVAPTGKTITTLGFTGPLMIAKQ